MTTAGLVGNKSIPTTQEFRRQVARTREELGRTVAALASKADAAVRAQEKTASVKKQVAQVTGRLRKTATYVGRLVEDENPDSVRAKARRAAATARGTDRTAWVAAGSVLAAALLVRRTRRARRGPSRRG
ncbi:DUF3618 domain-containing protein [Streptomyces sp. ISL-43]|uniref:DUF3618 domain-containing protein n=1 Tax=Streptomyces sp. ISL-43 TaxID=2819183 RepID=UPI001BE82A05|nr:DUF3618 domain-containing protein [Streptomyces sp. ISL-43]MBT2449785.1 DUF3618 domain-containing protein [Streptomyces sp. ISL-43]